MQLADAAFITASACLAQTLVCSTQLRTRMTAKHPTPVVQMIIFELVVTAAVDPKQTESRCARLTLHRIFALRDFRGNAQ